MSCENCTAKEKAQQLEKLKQDARIKAQEEKGPQAICYDPIEGHFFISYKTARENGECIVDIISEL